MGKMQNKLNEVMALTKSLRENYPTGANAFLGFLNKPDSVLKTLQNIDTLETKLGR